MPPSGKTIAALIRPFEDGNGPSHTFIERVFTTADATNYLGEGSKSKRLLDGLNGLRHGVPRSSTRRALPPDEAKLEAVMAGIAERLLEDGLITRSDADAAMHGSGSHPTASTTVEATPQENLTPVVPDPRVVMVVYGRDDEYSTAMFDWLRAIDLRPQEWDQLVERTGETSPYIGDVLTHAFEIAQAVICLFTPDEQVSLRRKLGGLDWRLQARPNVLIEAGMSLVKEPKRTIFVVVGPTDVPSDLAGRHYVSFDGSVKDRHKLAGRLRNAGCSVDTSGSQWLDDKRFPNRTRVAPEPR